MLTCPGCRCQVIVVRLPWLNWSDEADAGTAPGRSQQLQPEEEAGATGPKYEYHKAIRFHGCDS